MNRSSTLTQLFPQSVTKACMITVNKYEMERILLYWPQAFNKQDARNTISSPILKISLWLEYATSPYILGLS